MIVDRDEQWEIDTSMLMALYRHNSYESAQECIDNLGRPKAYRVRIAIFLEEIPIMPESGGGE